MSTVLPVCPDSMKAQNLQIWNNAAFDDSGGDAIADEPPGNPTSWLPLQPIAVNGCGSPDKENRAFPVAHAPKATAPLPLTPYPGKGAPLHLTPYPGKGAPFPLTPYPGKGSAKVKFLLENGGVDEDDREIDVEIEFVQKEIERLKARLEALRIRKSERDSRVVGDSRRGRVVPARFMDPNQSSCKKPDAASPAQRKAEEKTSANAKTRKRAVSMGPSEIRGALRKIPESLPPSRTPLPSALKTRQSYAVGAPIWSVNAKKALESTPVTRSARSVEARRRGLSLGPAEIVLAGTSRQMAGIRKLQSSIQEDKAEENRSRTVSPKSRKPAVDLRRGVATVGSMKTFKKEDIGSLEPKTLLFQDGQEEQEESAAAPKASHPPRARSRIIPSRYSLITPRACPESKRRKWSLPEKEEEELGVKGTVKKSRVSLPVIRDQGRKFKDTTTLAEAPVVKGQSDTTAVPEASPPTPSSSAGKLPRIRTSRGGAAETPGRDSGPAKRVAELIGRRTHFGHRISEQQPDDACSQILDFEDSDEACEAASDEEQVP